MLGRLGGALLLLALAGGLVPHVSSAQPQEEAQGSPPSTELVDGVNGGLGLTAYQGELTPQSAFMIDDVLRGGVNAFVGVDRTLEDPLFVGLEVGFSRIRTRSQWKSFSNNIFRLEAQTGVGIDWIRPDFLRFFSGINLLLHHPTHIGDNSMEGDWEVIESFTSSKDNPLRTKDVGSVSFSSSIPLFIVIDNHVRIGARFMLDDYIDNTTGGSGTDLLFHVTLMHRFGI